MPNANINKSLISIKSIDKKIKKREDEISDLKAKKSALQNEIFNTVLQENSLNFEEAVTIIYDFKSVAESEKESPSKEIEKSDLDVSSDLTSN